MTTIAASAIRDRRSRRAGGLLVLLLLAPLLLGATAPGDGTPDAHGYWWRSPVLAADQTVPEGGLVVAGQPEGPLAVSALRFTLDDPDERAASIHLTVDSDTRDAFIEEPLLYACPAEEDWEPAEGGDWADVPEEHCSPGTSAEGEIGEDGEYVFVVSQFIQNGEIDVIITPGVRGAVPSPLLLQMLNEQLIEQVGTGAPWPGPPTRAPGSSESFGGSNFRVTFAPPDEDTFRTGQDSADDSVTSLTFDGESGGFDSDFDSDGGGESAGTNDDFGGGGSTTAEPPSTSDSGDSSSSPSSGDSGTPPSPETAEPPTAADDGGDEPVQSTPPDGDDSQAPVTLEDPQAGGVGGAEPAGSSGADPRMLGAVVLALGALGAGVLAMGPQGLALGTGSSASKGGLAQFARARSGPPPSL